MFNNVGCRILDVTAQLCTSCNGAAFRELTQHVFRSASSSNYPLLCHVLQDFGHVSLRKTMHQGSTAHCSVTRCPTAGPSDCASGLHLHAAAQGGSDGWSGRGRWKHVGSSLGLHCHRRLMVRQRRDANRTTLKTQKIRCGGAHVWRTGLMPSTRPSDRA